MLQRVAQQHERTAAIFGLTDYILQIYRPRCTAPFDLYDTDATLHFRISQRDFRVDLPRWANKAHIVLSAENINKLHTAQGKIYVHDNAGYDFRFTKPCLVVSGLTYETTLFIGPNGTTFAPVQSRPVFKRSQICLRKRAKRESQDDSDTVEPTSPVGITMSGESASHVSGSHAAGSHVSGSPPDTTPPDTTPHETSYPETSYPETGYPETGYPTIDIAPLVDAVYGDKNPDLDDTVFERDNIPLSPDLVGF